MIDEILNAKGNLYQTIVPNTEVVLRYRLLSIKEYNIFKTFILSGVLSEQDCHMQVFERCFLGQSFVLSDNMPAGILISVGALIMWLSGDSDGQTLINDIDRHRNLSQVEAFFSYMLSAILTAIPAYKVEEIESWDREKLLRIFTIAENVLEKQREGYSRLQLEMQEGKKQKPAHGIDFDKENRLLKRHQNQFDLEEAENKLTKEQLQRLERTRR